MTPCHVERLSLPGGGMGTSRTVEFRRYGTPGAGPKAYLQASLHADETPALLVAHHLAALLDSGRYPVLGEVVLVPFANPVGLGQRVGGRLLGRFSLGTTGNFNRGFPLLADRVADKVAGRLGADAAANVAVIRAALVETVDAMQAGTELGALRLALFRAAIDADIVLDLHCDNEALLHLYLCPQLWPAGRDLAADLGSPVTLLAEISGGEPFDEAVGCAWWELAKRFPDLPIPPACLTATVELRGEQDVTHDLAAADAANIIRFLQRRGVLGGDPGPLPPLPAEATLLSAVEPVKAPATGVVVYAVQLGDRVAEGDLIAEIVQPAQAVIPVRTRQSGVVFTRRSDRYVEAGQPLVKIAGAAPLPDRVGYLLGD